MPQIAGSLLTLKILLAMVFVFASFNGGFQRPRRKLLWSQDIGPFFQFLKFLLLFSTTSGITFVDTFLLGYLVLARDEKSTSSPSPPPCPSYHSTRARRHQIMSFPPSYPLRCSFYRSGGITFPCFRTLEFGRFSISTVARRRLFYPAAQRQLWWTLRR